MAVLRGLRVRVSRLALVGALSVSAVALTAAPSGAGPCAPNADGRIKVSGGAAVGSGILNQTAAGQFVGQALEPGQVTNLVVRYRNTSANPRGISVGPSINDLDNFRVRAFVGAQNITGTFIGDGVVKFTGVPAGRSTPALRIEVKMRNSAGSGDFLAMIVEGRFGNSFECGDRVATEMGSPT